MITYLFSILICFNIVRGNPPELLIPFQNSNQLLLVFSESNRSPEYERILRELSKDPLGLDRRDIIVFEVFPNGGINPDGSAISEEEAKVLRDYYQVAISSFTLIVINRHLEEIFRSAVPLPVGEIFKNID